MVSLVTKLITLICSLPIGSNAVAPSDSVYHSDQILPCLERITKLEKMLEEIKTKRVQIPVEKEQMLERSMDRIKSVELDLDKTKKVGPYLYPCNKLEVAKWTDWVTGVNGTFVWYGSKQVGLKHLLSKNSSYVFCKELVFQI